jgi:Protein of unknown function (DUF3311)
MRGVHAIRFAKKYDWRMTRIGSRRRCGRPFGEKHMQTAGKPGRALRLWHLLLLIPYLAMLWVGSYNRATPELAGIPFFYWYQLLWIILGAILTWVVYLATARD